MRRALNYRQCYITRMPYVETGKLWDVNPISKRKNPKIPMKRELDPAVYGGYNTKTAAYFFIYEVADKRGKHVLKLSMLPVFVLNGSTDDVYKLVEDYARKVASEENLALVELKAPQVLKNQLVEIGGSRLYVNAEEEMKCGSQLAFSLSEIELLEGVLQGEITEGDALNSVYLILAERLAACKCKMLADSLSLGAHFDSFLSLPIADKREIIEKTLLLCRGSKQAQAVNLSLIGGAKMAGRLRPARTSVPADFYIIDQSVTGMFERRTRVGL